MEVIETCSKRKTLLATKPTTCPCNVKYAKRYVQPPRVKSFAPERLYKTPSKQLDANTTYHLSYLNVDSATTQHARSQPFRPIHTLEKNIGQFFHDTTNKLSYRPVWQVVKREPILPKHRPITVKGTMENITTVRHDYVAKHAERPEMIVPCGNIRTCSAPIDDRTMARMSYVPPGPMEPTISFKPILKYRPPSQPLPNETTQKLSYLPYVVGKKELYPWTQKLTYKRPVTAMCSKTTYSESYLENESVCTEKSFAPAKTYVFPYGAEFADKTVYKESYLPGVAERVEPIVRRGSISIPEAKMLTNTTNKLSYQQVWTEKRKPYLPRFRSMLGTGTMQSETTTRCEYAAKAIARPDRIIPSDNIRIASAPLQGDTTTGLSYMKPGATTPVRNYKPVIQYCRPEVKLDTETINKLSYQAWMPRGKDRLPWAQKSKYQPPIQPMVGDTVYHMSYAAPGHYVEDVECVCLSDEENKSAPMICTT